MLIQYLEAYNIYPEIIKLWQMQYGDKLLPIQELAVKQYHILDGESLLLFSPTSSGKTFVAEMAAIKQSGDKKKVIFAVPLKSLAEEKFRQFQSTLGRFGIRTVISTRDRSEYDFAVESSQFDIAVMVYEKVNSLLIKRQDIIDHLGLVVIDELQMLGDESRGTDLDLLLTKLILRKELTQTNPDKGKGLQLLGLSAVLGNAERIARWLDIPLLVHGTRPVELRKGILYNGVFEYQEHNSKQIGEEIFFAPQPGSKGAIHRARSLTKKGLIERPFTAREPDVIPAKAGIQSSNSGSNSVGLSNPHSAIINHQSEADPYNTDQILALVQYLAEIKKESSIVFVPQKRLTRLWAGSLSDKVNLVPASNAITALDQLEESLIKDELKLLLQHGIAYHTADLSPEFRQIIEFYFRTGEIRIVIATSTLGQGVNLAAKNAVIVPQTVKYRRNKMRNFRQLTMTIC
ncbi:MAG: DEAD/DEAH box helicase [bacterium]